MVEDEKGLTGEVGGETALRLDRTLCIDDAATECAEPDARELVEPLWLRSDNASLWEVCSSS